MSVRVRGSERTALWKPNLQKSQNEPLNMVAYFDIGWAWARSSGFGALAALLST